VKSPPRGPGILTRGGGDPAHGEDDARGSQPGEGIARVQIQMPSLLYLGEAAPPKDITRAGFQPKPRFPPEKPARTAEADKVFARDFGFHAEDATPALQAAIDSGARLVVVTDTGSPWKLKTVRLRNRVTVAFEPGVTIRGLPAGKEAIFTVVNQTGVVLRGHQTVVEGQGRPILVRLDASSNVSLIGLVLRGGGQGIYVGKGFTQAACRDIYMKSLVIEQCRANGILVASAENLLIADTRIRQAGAAGLAFIPEQARDRLDARIRSCRFETNPQAAIRVNARALNERSPDLSLSFSNCQLTGPGWGAELSQFRDKGPGGLVEFKDCLFYDLRGPGVIAESISAHGPVIRFRHCIWKRVARSGDAPVMLSGPDPLAAKAYGGMEFDDSLIEDDWDRPGVATTEAAESNGCANIRGRLLVVNPYGASVDFGPKAQGIALEVVDRTGPGEAGHIPAATATAETGPNRIRVYPNPVPHGQLFFRFSPAGPESVWVRLFDLAGEMVLSQRQEISQSFPVVACSVGHLAAGIYIYLAQEGGRRLKGKIGIIR